MVATGCFRGILRWITTGLLVLAGWCEVRPAAANPDPPAARNAFIRFVPGQPGTGRVETAVRSYRDANGVTVNLFAAVHVGDRVYYRELQRRFAACDALLYEMIRDVPEDATPGPVSTDNPISQLQLGMRTLLNLEFQLEAIDYTATNFVHADLDPDTFLALQRERRESLLGLMLRVMLEEEARVQAGRGTTLDSFQLLLALMDPERGYALKLVLGRQMSQLEDLLAGIDQGTNGQGSVIVGARNEHAVRVLQDQIRKGKRRLGIFYGAGHMADFERRLAALGFVPIASEWLTAWDIRRRGGRPSAPRR